MIKIEGINIRIRDFALKDIEPFTYWQIGEHEWKNFDAPYYKKSDADIHAQIESLMDRISDTIYSNPRSRLVIADLSTDRLIGTVNSYWISQETNWLAAGIVLYDPRFWNSGNGSEALEIWIDYLFQSHPEIERLDLQTWSGNVRMMRLAERLGFTMEGCFRKARIVLGQYFDSVHYGILRSEWDLRALAHPKSIVTA